MTCIGRLAPEKNLGLLLDAFKAIHATDARARLLFVGDGPMQEELVRAVPEAIFAGRRSGDDLAAHFASADLFLMPSLTETFGNVTCEAMASGLPVVDFDYAAAAHLIRSGESGLLVPFGDHERFVEASCGLAAHRARRAALGRGARTRACAQGWADVIARFEALLVQAIQAGRSDKTFDVPTASPA